MSNHSHGVDTWQRLAAIGIGALGVVAACSQSSTDSEPPVSQARQAIKGDDRFEWTSTAPPFGATGRVDIDGQICRQTCKSGNMERGRCPGGPNDVVTECNSVPGLCTGTLIQRDLAITAGHCFTDYSSIDKLQFQPALRMSNCDRSATAGCGRGHGFERQIEDITVGAEAFECPS